MILKKNIWAVYMVALLVLSLFISEVITAEKTDDVYLIKLHNPELKAKYGVRHNFDVGFTTKLKIEEVKELQRNGIEVRKILLYHLIEPKKDCESWPECNRKNIADSTAGTFPSDQMPWGIKKIYNNPEITSTSGGAMVDVAVLDTGIYKDHSDLKNRVTQCVDFTAGGGTTVGVCDDKNGHGTHVSGTIAADGGDGTGIYGVAPEANILAYKVCGNSGCWEDDIAAAINYAGSNGAEIVSMSLGGDSQNTLIKDAISGNPHVLFVAAAGNDGPALNTIDYPGANVNVIAVGAIDVNENVASWSSRGINDGDFIIEEREVEFGAPGVGVESTWKDGSYAVISGTSMATPHVSGLAAKLWQGNATATRAFLQQRAKLHDLDAAGDDPATGFGLPTAPTEGRPPILPIEFEPIFIL